MKEIKYIYSILNTIWNYYGGIKALFRSPFFYISLIISLLSYNIWIIPNWWDLVLTILPSLLGFTLGGYAILLAFGDEKFIQLISGREGEERSPYMGLSSNFAVFIIVQILSILIALISKAFYVEMPSLIVELGKLIGCSEKNINLILKIFFWGFGYTLFIYSLSQSLAATLQIFRLTKWRDKFVQQNKVENETENKD